MTDYSALVLALTDHVRTPEGSRRFHEPVGAAIMFHGAPHLPGGGGQVASGGKHPLAHLMANAHTSERLYGSTDGTHLRGVSAGGRQEVYSAATPHGEALNSDGSLISQVDVSGPGYKFLGNGTSTDPNKLSVNDEKAIAAASQPKAVASAQSVKTGIPDSILAEVAKNRSTSQSWAVNPDHIYHPAGKDNLNLADAMYYRGSWNVHDFTQGGRSVLSTTDEGKAKAAADKLHAKRMASGGLPDPETPKEKAWGAAIKQAVTDWQTERSRVHTPEEDQAAAQKEKARISVESRLVAALEARDKKRAASLKAHPNKK